MQIYYNIADYISCENRIVWTLRLSPRLYPLVDPRFVPVVTVAGGDSPDPPDLHPERQLPSSQQPAAL